MSQPPPAAATPGVLVNPANPSDAEDGGPHASIDYKPGAGFRVTSAEGDFSLAVGLLGQARYRFTDGTDAEPKHFADVRHARVRARGHLFGVHNRYFMQLAFAPDEVRRFALPLPDEGGSARAVDVVGTSPLLDMYVRFDHLRDLNLQVGQFRVPFSRTRLLAPERLLFVDRGLVNDTFTLDRDIGATLMSEDFLGLDMLRYWLGIYIGEGRNASELTTGAGDRGFLISARVEALPLGAFDTANVIDFDRLSTPHLAVAVGYASLEGDATSPASAQYLGVQRLGSDQSALVDFSAQNFTADALFKAMGFSAQVTFHFRQVDPLPAGANGIGVEFVGGYLLEPVPISLGVRGGFVRITGDDSSLPEQDQLSFVLGYHMFENQLKAQLGFSHVWIRSVSEDPIVGSLGLVPGESNELTVSVTAAL